MIIKIKSFKTKLMSYLFSTTIAKYDNLRLFFCINWFKVTIIAASFGGDLCNFFYLVLKYQKIANTLI